MHKIASPQDLQAELRSLMAFVQAHGPEGKPDRQVLAAKLHDLADRVAGTNLTADKWIQRVVKHPGALHKYFGIPEDKDIPTSKIKAELAKLKKKEGDLSADEKKLQHQLNLALTLRSRSVPPPKGK